MNSLPIDVHEEIFKYLPYTTRRSINTNQKKFADEIKFHDREPIIVGIKIMLKFLEGNSEHFSFITKQDHHALFCRYDINGYVRNKLFQSDVSYYLSVNRDVFKKIEGGSAFQKSIKFYEAQNYAQIKNFLCNNIDKDFFFPDANIIAEAIKNHPLFELFKSKNILTTVIRNTLLYCFSMCDENWHSNWGYRLIYQHCANKFLPVNLIRESYPVTRKDELIRMFIMHYFP